MTTIKGYKPHRNQRLIHDSIQKDSAKYYVCNIGRQWGKTLFATNQLLFWAINYPGTQIGWVSPVYSQSKKVFDELERATARSRMFEFNRSELSIKGSKSTIRFFSGERPDNIRGNTFDFLVIDEMAFTRPELWTEVLQATILVKGKKVIFISTPKGKNHFYNLSLQHNYDDRYKYFHFGSYDNPMIDPNEIDAIRRSLPDHVFRQEYLAEFLDNSSGLFKDIRKNIYQGTSNSSGRLFGGLDIGRADDYTVLTILDQNQNMIYLERWRHDEWSNIIDKVSEQIIKHKALTYVEVNNQGDVFFEMLRNKCKNLIEPFVTTTKTKPIMIEDLAVQFEQSKIKLLDHNWLIDELESFTYIYDSKTRRVKYSAPNGIHDDGVISLALCVQAIKHLKQKGKYTILR